MFVFQFWKHASNCWFNGISSSFQLWLFQKCWFKLDFSNSLAITQCWINNFCYLQTWVPLHSCFITLKPLLSASLVIALQAAPSKYGFLLWNVPENVDCWHSLKQNMRESNRVAWMLDRPLYLEGQIRLYFDRSSPPLQVFMRKR